MFVSRVNANEGREAPSPKITMVTESIVNDTFGLVIL